MAGMGELVVIRHGQTEWSRSGQHTGVTDLPLLPDGEADGRRLRDVLAQRDITAAFVSEIKAEGYADVPAETAIRLKNHDVDREFIRRAKSQGYGNATLDELISLRNRGIVK